MSRLSTTPTLVLALALFTIAVCPAKAQVPLSPRSLGMGGAMIAQREKGKVFFEAQGVYERMKTSLALTGVERQILLVPEMCPVFLSFFLGLASG